MQIVEHELYIIFYYSVKKFVCSENVFLKDAVWQGFVQVCVFLHDLLLKTFY